MTQFLATGMTLAPLARWDQRASRGSVPYIPCLVRPQRNQALSN